MGRSLNSLFQFCRQIFSNSIHFAVTEFRDIYSALRVLYHSRIAFVITATLLFISIYLIFGYAQVEKDMLEVQKIFYLHVPAAMTVYLAFSVNFIFSIKYLIKRKTKDDLLAVSAAEIGIVFCTVVLLSGPIWAKYAWNTWWDWEARLTSTLVLWLMYIGYFILRSSLVDDKRRLYSAVLGTVAFFNVPVVHFATKFWKGKHHPERGTKFDVTSSMLHTWLIVLLVFIILFFLILIMQYHIKNTESRYEAIRRRHLEESS